MTNRHKNNRTIMHKERRKMSIFLGFLSSDLFDRPKIHEGYEDDDDDENEDFDAMDEDEDEDEDEDDEKDKDEEDDDEEDDDDEDDDDNDEQVNTTSCKPDDFLPLARERYHPHKALNPVKYKLVKSYENTN